MNNKFPFNHFNRFKENQAPTEILATNFNPQFTDKPIQATENKELTQEILEILKKKISSNKFNTYFNNQFLVDQFDDQSIDFIVSTPFVKKMIEIHYMGELKQSVRDLLGNDLEVTLKSQVQDDIVENKDEIKFKNAKSTSFILENSEEIRKVDFLSEKIDSFIDQSKTFDNFIVGPSNNIAYALSMSIAKEPGKSYPAFYLYGGSGLGKTHLIFAIYNYIRTHQSHLKIKICSANRFMNEMVESMKSNQASEFRKKFIDNVDVFIVDDVHELNNKTSTQNEFFHVFNELTYKGKQLIFTSDKTPKEIEGLEERIRTRLSSALPVEIQTPDYETRIAILKRKAGEKDLYLADDVANLIAKCIKSNVRELEGSLIKLQAYSSILKVDVDLEMAKELLKLDESLENQKTITIETITKTVAQYYKIPLGELRGKIKSKEIVLARQVSMYLIHRFLKLTRKEIGNYFSKRDHSTVIHSLRLIEERLKTDGVLSQQLLEIEKQF